MALCVSLGGAAHAQTSFTDWESALKPGATVAVGGVSQEFTYTSGAGGVTGVNPPSTNMAVTYTETLSATGEIASMVVQNANRSVSFHRANGDSISAISNGRLIYALSSDWTRKALAADPTVMGWKYQSFGVWVSGLGQAQGSMGAASVGAITPGTSVPQSGSATFTGLMGGIYNDSIGQDRIVSADMSLAVNFAAHSADFRTTNTRDKDGRAYSELDITGTFVSLPNHPALFGTLNTERLTGTSSAQFYGPAAEEVGGVFTMTPKSGQGLERLAGAFGGKRGTTSGGGGGGGAGGGGSTGFTSWSANQAGSTVVVPGKSQELAFTAAAGGGSNISAPSAVGSATFTEVINSAGVITGMTLATPNRTISFNTAAGDTIGVLAADSRILVAANAAGTKGAIAADPFKMGWNYQSFGVWEALDGPSAGSAGAISVGAATSGGSIPTSGSATFTGAVGGVYLDTTGVDAFVAAELTMSVNFSARTAGFSSGTMTNVVNGALYSGSALSGSLSYAAGSNALSGTLSTANGRLSGTATGQFFGPSAQEIGGVYALTPRTGSGVERLVGGFGAKR